LEQIGTNWNKYLLLFPTFRPTTCDFRLDKTLETTNEFAPMTHFTPYVIPSPPQTPVYVKDHLDVLSMDMDPLNLWEKDTARVVYEEEVAGHVTGAFADATVPGHVISSCRAPFCGSPCSVCTECCCDVCSHDIDGVPRDRGSVAGDGHTSSVTCDPGPGSAPGAHSWEDVDVEPLNLALANTCGKASVAFALPSGCDASSYDSDDESLMDSIMLDSSHETYTPSNFLGMPRDAEKMGSDQVHSVHFGEATFVSPKRSAHENLEKISMGLSRLQMC
jgi:hypothetical protein